MAVNALFFFKNHAEKKDDERVVKLILRADSLHSAHKLDSAMAIYARLSGAYHPSASKMQKLAACEAANAEAYIYMNVFNDNNTANSCINRALSIAEDVGEPSALASMYFNIGNYHYHYDDLPAAIQSYTKAFEIGIANKPTVKTHFCMLQLLFVMAEEADSAGIEKAWRSYDRLWDKDDLFFRYNSVIKQGITDFYSRPGEKVFEKSDSLFAAGADLLKTSELKSSITPFLEDTKSHGADTAILIHQLQLDLCRAAMLGNIGRKRESAEAYASLAGKAAALNSHRMQDKACRRYAATASAAHLDSLNREIISASDSISSLYASRCNTASYRKMKQNTDAEKAASAEREKQIFSCKAMTWSVVALLILLGTIHSIFVCRRRRKAGNATAGKKKNQQASLTKDEKERIYARVVSFFETSQDYLSRDFTIKDLGEKIGVHHRWCSQTINEVTGKNFSQVLTEYRLKEACRRLRSEEFAHHTFESIATGVGFGSGAYFSRVFKKEMGMTPKEFVNKCQSADL